MGAKLSRQSAAEENEEEAPRKVQPKGWGAKPASAEPDKDEDDDEDEVETQKAAIKGKITKPAEPEEDDDAEDETPPPPKGRAGFSEGVQKQLAKAETTEEEDDEPQIRKSPEDRKPRGTAAGKVLKEKDVDNVKSEPVPTSSSYNMLPREYMTGPHRVELYLTAKQLFAVAKALAEV